MILQHTRLAAVIFMAVFVSISPACAHAGGPDCMPGLPRAVLTEPDIAAMQGRISALPVGERIAFWADAFIGTPYDTDPLGAYVSGERVVCDTEVDCMYLVFRAAELATSGTPEEAELRALELRFRTKGVIRDGRVANYDERFEYGEDMITSGKWGRDVTSELGITKDIPGARGRVSVTILPVAELSKPETLAGLCDGDVVFFVKDPARRVVGEVIGHLGIIKLDDKVPMLVHASGSKSGPGRTGGGEVKKVPLAGYLKDTKFIGVQVTRFE